MIADAIIISEQVYAHLHGGPMDGMLILVDSECRDIRGVNTEVDSILSATPTPIPMRLPSLSHQYRRTRFSSPFGMIFVFENDPDVRYSPVVEVADSDYMNQGEWIRYRPARWTDLGDSQMDLS